MESEIEDHDRNLILVSQENFNGLDAVRRDQDSIARVFQTPAHQLELPYLILDKQNDMAMNRDASNLVLLTRTIQFDGDALSIHKRQIDAKCGTAPGLAHHIDEAAVVGHDPVGDRETESSALALFFGSKKWLEYTAFGTFVHSDTGILHADACVSFLFCVLKMRSKFGSGYRLGLQQQFSALRHGVSSVNADIKQDLIDLVWIRQYRRKPQVQIQTNVDRSRQGATQKHLEFLQHVIQVDWFEPDGALFGDCEQLPHSRGSAFDRFVDDIQTFVRISIARSGVSQKRGVSSDNVENIVEIMSYAACQHADTFHLLSLAQLLFQSLFFIPFLRQCGIRQLQFCRTILHPLLEILIRERQFILCLLQGGFRFFAVGYVQKNTDATANLALTVSKRRRSTKLMNNRSVPLQDFLLLIQNVDSF